MMLVVFTDLDGTLLDHDTYSHAQAGEALALLGEKGVPLVMVSSKTFPEMKALYDELRLTAPFVFENGGGIYWPEGGGRTESLGMSVPELAAGRDALEAAFGEAVLFITDMDAAEISRRTGLPRERAILSRKRTASLPFVLSSGKAVGAGELSRINDAVRRDGFSVTRGGRFYHFSSAGSDKGAAIARVTGYYRAACPGPVTTVGIGDSENDLPMLGAVDIPVLVRKRDGTVIAHGDARVRVTAGAGPAGFNEAVVRILRDAS